MITSISALQRIFHVFPPDISHEVSIHHSISSIKLQLDHSRPNPLRFLIILNTMWLRISLVTYTRIQL
jgi:hypothetical protein